jgi:serine/threonine protein kinase
MTSLVGHTLLGQYQFVESIGQGGMADVYKVWDHQRAAHLAAKVLRADLARDRELLRRFQQEAAVLEELRHPHIVRFYGLEREGGTIFILMEYITGQSLREMLLARGSPLSSSEVIQYLRSLAAALNYAHQKKIYHCDVKASNVLIDSAGDVYIGDFGIAHILGGTAGGIDALGTPTHMAPEQCSGGTVDARTDVYGLGVTLYEMVTGGRVPFVGDTKSTSGTKSERIRFQHLREPPPPPRRANPALPVSVEHAILRALEKPPLARFPSVMALFSAVEAAYGSSGPPSGAGKKKASTPTSMSPQAMLVVRQGEHRGRSFAVQQGMCCIGRSRTNDVRLSQRGVSRRHAVIRWARGSFWLQDEQSLHGTYLNGRRVQAQRLTNGDQIQIGDTVFEFRVGT